MIIVESVVSWAVLTAIVLVVVVRLFFAGLEELERNKNL